MGGARASLESLGTRVEETSSSVSAEASTRAFEDAKLQDQIDNLDVTVKLTDDGEGNVDFTAYSNDEAETVVDYYPLRTDINWETAVGYGTDGKPTIYTIGDGVNCIPKYNDKGGLWCQNVGVNGADMVNDTAGFTGSQVASLGTLKQAIDELKRYSNTNFNSSFNISNWKRLGDNVALEFKTPRRMYIVQCMDSSYTLQKMTIRGGTKDGTTCKLLLVLVGDIDSSYTASLALFTTGSISLSSLGGTGSEITSVTPATDCHLQYFELGRGVD